VRFAWNWIPSGNHFGVFAAKDRGFYRDANLDVDIQRGYSSSDTLKRVATGSLMLRSIAARHPEAREPRLGRAPRRIARAPRRMAARDANAAIDARKISIQNLSPSAKYASLAAKTVDAIVGSTVEEPAIQNAAQKTGSNVRRFRFSDYGVDYYSIGLIGSDEISLRDRTWPGASSERRCRAMRGRSSARKKRRTRLREASRRAVGT
jgi:NMT1/THI5 like